MRRGALVDDPAKKRRGGALADNPAKKRRGGALADNPAKKRRGISSFTKKVLVNSTRTFF